MARDFDRDKRFPGDDKKSKKTIGTVEDFLDKYQAETQRQIEEAKAAAAKRGLTLEDVAALEKYGTTSLSKILAKQHGTRKTALVSVRVPMSVAEVERDFVLIPVEEGDPIAAMCRRFREEALLQAVEDEASGLIAPGTLRDKPYKQYSQSGPALQRSLVRSIPGPHSARNEHTSDDLEDAAQIAFSGSSSSVPFFDDIQSAFGADNDISGIAVHSDDKARVGADKLGAGAFASGHRIALGEKRDLHTVAHEVAHVLQQHGDSAVGRGVGKAGDHHERAADAIADRVVAGKSAADLLPGRGAAIGSQTQSFGRGAGATAAIQLKEKGASGSSAAAGADKRTLGSGAGPDEAWVFARQNEAEIIATIQGNLVTWAPPQVASISWADGGVAKAFAPTMQELLAGRQLWTMLPELLYPADPWAIINQHRMTDGGTTKAPTGPLTWNQQVGQMLALAMKTQLKESIRRMAPRYSVQQRAKGPQGVVAADLIASKPLDLFTAKLLCNPLVMRSNAPDNGRRKGKGKGKVGTTDPALFPDGIRVMQDWEWMGAKDPTLWNYLRVADPADATAEEVAVMIYGGYTDTSAASKSYLFTPIKGGLFRLHPQWAHALPYVAMYAPQAYKDYTADIDNGDIALAGSSLATDIALAQAPKPEGNAAKQQGATAKPDFAELEDVLAFSERQLQAAKELLAPWQQWQHLIPALQWTAKHRASLMQIPDERLVKLTHVFKGQRDVLFEALGGLRDVTGMMNPQSDGGQGPVHKVVHAYALAIGESFLYESAKSQLAAAHAAKRGLSLTLLDSSLTANRDALVEYNSSRDGQASPNWQADQFATNQQRIVDLHGKLDAGIEIADGEAELLAADMAEFSFETGTLSLLGQVGHLRNQLRDGGSGLVELIVSACNGDYRSMAPKLDGFLTAVTAEVFDAYRFHKRNDLKDVPASDKRKRAEIIQNLVHRSQSHLETLKANIGLREFVVEVTQKLADQERAVGIVSACVKIAIMIGVSVVAGALGQIAGAALRGQILADAAAASMLRVAVAESAGTVVGLTVDSGLNALGGMAVTGENGVDAFLSNFITSGVVSRLLGPLQKAASSWQVAALEVKTLNLWQRSARTGTFVIAKGATLTAEMISGAAVSYMVHQARHATQPTPQQAEDWLMQGASMVIGAWIGQRMHAFTQRAANYAESAPQLRLRAKKVDALAAHLTSSSDKSAAMDTLIEYHALLRAEHDLISSGHFNSRLPATSVEALRRGNEQEMQGIASPGMDTMPLRLAGLSPEDGSGRVWAGTSDEIANAIAKSQAAGVRVLVNHDASAKTWDLTYNNRIIKVVEIDRAVAHGEKPRTVVVGKDVERPSESSASAHVADEHASPGKPIAAEPSAPAARAEPTGNKQMVSLVGVDEGIMAAAARAIPREGYFDVIVHGDANSFYVTREQVDVPVDHHALATYLKKHGVNAQKIRLISCETGKSALGIAQRLADKLKVEVLAPSLPAWIDGTGQVGVGKKPGEHTGQWVTFTPRNKPPQRGGKPEPYREPPPMKAMDNQEVIEPLHVADPYVDKRERVSAGKLASLSQKLGVRIEIDSSLYNGVEVHAKRAAGGDGFELASVHIKIGTNALLRDVHIHHQTVRLMKRANTLWGRLRTMVENWWNRRSGKAVYQPGTRGYVAEMERFKLRSMLQARGTEHAAGLIDEATLRTEVADLDAQIASQEESLLTMRDEGHLQVDGDIVIAGPDIGKSTRDAQAKGYKLPGEGNGVGEGANPDHYYYRRSEYDKNVYELARKSSAPRDAESYRARTVNGKFVGLESGAVRPPAEIVPVEATPAQVVARLRESEGFGPYAEMLVKEGIASNAVIDGAVKTTRNLWNAKRGELRLDWLRHEVKQRFRAKVEAKLLNTGLAAEASYHNMRRMLEGLANADRGNLAELWYRKRYRPHLADTNTHVKFRVERTSGKNEGKVETRVSDLRDGRKATEIKSGKDVIDKEQFGASADMMNRPDSAGVKEFDKLEYVFLDPEGAIANLEFLEDAFSRFELEGKFRIEAFDFKGRRRSAESASDVRILRRQLEMTRGQQ